MSADAESQSSAKRLPAKIRELPLHGRIFYSGVIILVAGLAGAVLIYYFAADDSGTAAIEFANPRAYEFQIERLGGKVAVYVVRFNEWFGGLWHGRPLAFTVAILAIVIALACFWVADRMARQNEQSGPVE